MESNPNLEIRRPQYVITIFSGRSDPIDENDDNVDVQVTLNDGSFYTATVFTLVNLQTQLKRSKRNGDCAGGLYFFCKDMIVVEHLNTEVVERLVADLFENDELAEAFDFHSPE